MRCLCLRCLLYDILDDGDTVMLRTEMVDNLLDSYTKRELESLAVRLGISIERFKGIKYNDPGFYMVSLKDDINDILFDPCGSYHEFNKLTEKSNVK